MKLISVGFMGGNRLILSISKDGLMDHIDFETYYAVCDKYNIKKLPYLPAGLIFYKLSTDYFLPSYAQKEDGGYLSIGEIGITKDMILETFENFEILVREASPLKDNKFYPFDNKNVINLMAQSTSSCFSFLGLRK